MADDTIKVDLTKEPSLDRPNDLPVAPDLSAVWEHKGFNKLPMKEQMERLSGTFPGIESYTPMDYQNYRDKIGKPINQELRITPPSTLDHIINFARPMIAGAAGSAAGSALGASGVGALGSGAAATGTYGLTDALLQKIQSSPPESFSSSLLAHLGMDDPISRTLANTGEQALIGKMGGKVLDPIFRGVGGFLKSGLDPRLLKGAGGIVGDDAMQALNPTYSQYFKAVTGKTAPISKWVEDTFNSAYKAKLFSNAQNMGVKQLQSLADDDSGQVADSHILSSDIVQNQLKNLHKSTQFSDKQNSILSNIAKLNTNVEPNNDFVQAVPKPNFTPAEQMMISNPNVDPTNPIASAALAKQSAYQSALESNEALRTTEGPVSINKVWGFAQDKVDELTSKYGTNDPKKMLPEDALIFKESSRLANYKNKIGFNEANSSMKAWEDTGYKTAPPTKQLGNFDKGNSESVNPIQQFYRQLNDKMGQDITNSIGQWKNDLGGAAKKAWQQSQDAISQRRALFGDSSATSSFLDDTKTSIPSLNNAIKDPKSIDDLIKSGNIELPNGTLHTTDTKTKLAGYTLNKFLNDSSIDQGNGATKFNTASFADKWNNPDFLQVKDKLFTPGAQKAVNDIITNTNTIDAPGSSGTFKYLAIHRGGLAMSSAVVGGLFGGSMMHGVESGTVAGGLMLGGVGLAKLLSNPNAARVLVGMSAGKIPEGMTRTSMDTILKGALNGAIVYGLGKNGEKTTFQVNHDELVPK